MVITKKAIENDQCIKKISSLLKRLDIKHNNINDYILAFIHKSIVNERPEFAPTHNERLEFLGDAVLELVITTTLFEKFPKKQEGELTDLRSAIVRGKNLANIARTLQLEEYLYLGKGEELSGGRNNNYILANTLEAFLGAIYTDLGFLEASNFINTYIYITIDEILENKLFKDFKTMVQEYAQAEFDITPTYKVLEEKGPDHDKVFVIGVFLGKKHIGTGSGSSKKRAQEKAAEDGFKNMKK